MATRTTTTVTAKRKQPAEAVTAAKNAKGNANAEICDFLNQLADYERNVSRNIHKYNAYRKAARSIAAHSLPLRSGKDAQRLDGVGKKIGEKIEEFLTTGGLKKLDKINANPEAAAIQLIASVVGFGPAAAQNYVQKGITTLEALKQEDGLSNAQKIGLKHFADFNERIPRAEVEALRQAVFAELREVDDRLEGQVCGSFRRGAATSGDIDILLTHPDFKSTGDGEALGKTKKKLDPPFDKLLDRVISHLKKVGLVTDVLSLGESKFMGVARLPETQFSEAGLAPPRRFRRIDMRLWPVDQYPLALLYFTGSDETNKTMRRKAIDLGFRLSEYSLRPMSEDDKPGRPLPVSSEKDVFDALDMTYLEPAQR
ncbi:uncharacterized protein MONBRDRAFT_33482 [Monosiga brevicollis MX1]|uniref:DNA polymerase n=1 Tax=Monosiga brevicollis TaxID=81824 RepID=A9V5M0_MONBE|nr:uncharacterized protein MONBRDRAFT_33482 [Monosiga brevicollis MX1]EDQ87142.1 predicted protein [Monosiga brevicollis MX1]|eukprot:XP_001748085.1 hypothetical protein [Monosiga brevicollis MX1]